MFDIGGAELLVIMVVALVVLGPKELPGAIRTVSMWMRRARELAREFQGGLDDLARETEIEKMKAELRASIEADELRHSIRNEVGAVRHDVEAAMAPPPALDAPESYGPPPPPSPYDDDIAREIAKTPAELPPPGAPEPEPEPRPAAGPARP